MKKTITYLLSGLAVLALLIFLLFQYRLSRAERLTDLVSIDLTLMYDCVNKARQKGDQVYSNDGKREGCGVPDARVEFMDGRDKSLNLMVVNKKGRLYKTLDDRIDHPLGRTRSLRITSTRCGVQQVSIRFGRKRHLYGESMSSYRYQLNLKKKILCP